MHSEPEQIYVGQVVGTGFYDFRMRPDRIRDYDLVLSREPDNRYDPNAIAVLAVRGTIAKKVGYIPRNCTEPIHKAFARNAKIAVELVCLNQSLKARDRPGDIPRICVTAAKPGPNRTPTLSRPGTRRLLLPARDSANPS